MRFFGILILMLLSSIVSNAQPNWLWAKVSDVQSYASGSDVVVDSAGNIYVTGYFDEPEISFDSITLSSQGQCDVFVAKYNPEGNVIWAKSYGGSDLDKPCKMAIDKQSNLIIYGTFESSSISFDSVTLFNHGNSDVFLVKMDTSGNTIWLKNIYSVNDDGCSALDIDTNNNILISGTYNSAYIHFDTLVLNASGNSNFLAKYSSNGNAVWAKNFGVSIHDLCTDNNNILLTGCFDGQCTEFGNDTLKSMGSGDIFIAKLDSIGAPLWARAYGEFGYDQGLVIGCSESGKTFISGTFNSPYLVVIDTLNNIMINYSNNFVIILDSTGQPLHATTYDFPGPIDLCVQKDDAFYIITSGIVPMGGNRAYIFKYDSICQLIWTKDFSCLSSAIEVLGSGSIITTGNYSYRGYFDGILFSALDYNSINFFLAKTDTVCGVSIQFNSAIYDICLGVSNTLSVPTGYDNYLWSTGDTATILAISPTVNTTYSVTVTSGACRGVAATTVRVHPQPPTPVIHMSGDTLFSNAPSGNHWYIVPSYLIPEATGAYYIPDGPGSYYVVLTDSNGCVSDSSNHVYFTDVSVPDINSNSGCTIFPNPGDGEFAIELKNKPISDTKIYVFDMMGGLIYEHNFPAGENLLLNLSNLAAGLYSITLQNNEVSISNKIIKIN